MVLRFFCCFWSTRPHPGLGLFVALHEHQPEWLKGGWNQVGKCGQDPWLIPILALWGEEGRQCVCTAVAQRAPCIQHVFTLNYGLFHLSEGTPYSFPLCHTIIIISAVACDGSLPWGVCSGCRRCSKMLQMMLCAILAVHFLHQGNQCIARGENLVHLTIRKFLGMPVWSGTGACRLLFAFYLLSAPSQVEQPSSLSVFLTSGNAGASWYVLTSHSGTAGLLSVPMSSLPLKQPFIIHHVQ